MQKRRHVNASGRSPLGMAARSPSWPPRLDGLTPPTKAQHLTVARTRRNPDIDSPVPKLDSFRRAIDGIEKINFKAIADVGTTPRLTGAGAPENG